MAKLNGLYLLSQYAYDEIYGPNEREEISNLVHLISPPLTKEELSVNPSILNDVDVILSGWGVPRMDQEFLSHAPNLKAVFHGAGSVKHLVSDALWERGVRVFGAAGANAVPVAEFVLSQILFCLKLGWQFTLDIRKTGAWPRVHDDGHFKRVFGAYHSTIGIISLGAISLRLIELLKPFDLNVLVYSTYLSDEEAAALGVKKCSLEGIFKESDVVSLHSPASPKNIGLITGEYFRMMNPYASFINTARGAVVNQVEMIEALRDREDLVAVLDVTEPEPPPPGDPIYSVPNIVITPHIAGSLGRECYRMGDYIAKELRRFLNSEPPEREITQKEAAYFA